MSSLSTVRSSPCREPLPRRSLFGRLRRWWVRRLASVEVRGDAVRNSELGYRLAAWRLDRRGKPAQAARLRQTAQAFRAARNRTPAW